MFHCYEPVTRAMQFELMVRGVIRADKVREAACADCLPVVNDLIERFKRKQEEKEMIAHAG